MYTWRVPIYELSGTENGPLYLQRLRFKSINKRSYANAVGVRMINLKQCPECNRYLVSLGFRYYSHPPLKDHFDRTKDAVYQCTHVGKVIRIPR